MEKEKLDPNQNIYKNIKTLIISALTFVSALAWNSAFQIFFERNKLLNKGGPWIYASAVTIITLLLLLGIHKLDNFLS